MGPLMLDAATSVIRSSAFRDRLVAWLDAATVLAVALLISNLLFEGFRLRLGDWRLTATSPVRTALIAAALTSIRHWLVREPTLLHRLVAAVRSAWTSPTRLIVLPAFLASRSMVLAIGFFAVILIGYAPKTPPLRISHNEIVNLPLRWDAGWYLQLALDGYSYNRDARNQGQQNIAFFPAYPLLTRAGAAWLGARSSGFGDEIRGNRAEWQYFQHRRIVLAAMAVSLGAFAWGLVYLCRLTREMFDPDAADGAVLIASAYPYALFFSAMYTEALFLLVTIAAFYHLRREEYTSASIWGLVAGLTRPNGCLLSVPLAILAVQQAMAGAPAAASLRTRRLLAGIATAAMPGMGMLLFSAYLYQLTGRPLAWLDAHQAWGRVATNVEELISSRMTYIADQGIYTYSVSEPIELLNAVPAFGAMFLAIPIVRRMGLAYGILILIMLLPPLLRGGFLSLGRVTSTLFPLFIYGGWVLRGNTRSSVVLAMAGLQAFLAVLFFTWRPFY
jgi:uncharacterized membrane protein YvlD (DUF360 family)